MPFRKLRGGIVRRARTEPPKIKVLRNSSKKIKTVQKHEIPETSAKTHKKEKSVLSSASLSKDVPKPAAPTASSSKEVQGPGSFESVFLPHLSEKQRSQLPKEFREKVEKIGKSLLALAASKREFLETDAKVARLEETYGKTMKIQDIWRYQERAGLAAILGQDPQAAINVSHVFTPEQHIMYNSVYPRNRQRPRSKSQSEACTSRPSPEPARARTRAQRSAEMNRYSTDDEL